MSVSEIQRKIQQQQDERDGRNPITEYSGDFTSAGATTHFNATNGDFLTPGVIDSIRKSMTLIESSPVIKTYIEKGEDLAEVMRKALNIINLGMPLPDYIQVGDTVVTNIDLLEYLKRAPAQRT